MSAILNSTLDQEEVRKRAMVAATRLMNCEVGSLLLLDEETNELYFEVALGEKGEKVKEIRLKVGEGIAGWVAEYGEPLLITDVSKDPRHSRKADERSEFKTRDMLCVPLKIKSKVIGVLEAVNKLDKEAFNNEDLELFKMLANQVAIAIDNAKLYRELQETFLQTAEALADAIEKRDPYTGGHTKRVVNYCMSIIKYIDMDHEEKERIKISAILHDIGKIGIKDIILRKTSELDKEEFEEMKKHPILGQEIMEKVSQLNDVIPGMRYHHERLDGKGYPDGLSGNKIPLVAKIIAVADAFDAMTTDRPYRKALKWETAIDSLKSNSGKQFDWEVVKAFIKSYQNGDIFD
ncbi:MAG: HD domain-containing protein [Thermodesulfobacteriota bacterium]|nr:HD domain-containing protein [Thermodesulfobacteriota bacterium]